MPNEDDILSRMLVLETELNETKKALKTLERKLEANPVSSRTLMQRSLRCPNCQHTEILFVKKLESLQGAPVRVGIKTNFLKVKYFGVLQAFICSSCGHAEMQIETPKEIKGRKNVQVLNAPESSEGPYR